MSRLLNEWIASPNRLCGRRQRCTVRPLNFDHHASAKVEQCVQHRAPCGGGAERCAAIHAGRPSVKHRASIHGSSCASINGKHRPATHPHPARSTGALCIDQREAPSAYTSAPCSIHGSAVRRSTGSTVRLPATRPTPCFDSPGTLCVDQRRDAVLNGGRNPALERGRGRASMA